MSADQSILARRIAPLLEHRAYRDAAELLLAGLAFLLYFVVRANVIDRPDLALANSRHLMDLEKTLGIFHESAWQRDILDKRLLVKYFNFAYFWLDFPLIAAVGLLMYFKRRREYTFTRDAILCSGAVALVCYALFPVAPPRLVPEAGLVDTLQRFNNLSYQAQSTSFFVNPYAAMPSLHVGWAVLLAIGVIMAFGSNRLIVAVALLYPLSQWASTVFTGNHFVIDGFGGLAVAAAGLAFATFMQRRGYATLGRMLGVEYQERSKRRAQAPGPTERPRES
ncbi:MAG TPA: phosphatase PAP2 family protein [Dehalococcoidia bacterium]|nr:phosphatase PAP2 family protein [Dehalococcoidia bacterium]